MTLFITVLAGWMDKAGGAQAISGSKSLLKTRKKRTRGEGLEAKKREVVQLLRYYGDWHGPYGGAGVPNLEELGEYGPAGMIVAGMAFDEEGWSLLAKSYKHLGHALVLLERDHFEAWLLLKRPYTGDPGDPRIIDEWREKRPGLMEWHDFAVTKLAGYLRFRDLYVPWSSRKQTRKPATIKEMNDQFYEDYEKLRQDGLSKRKAIQTAAEWNDYSEQRGYEIVRIREGGEKRQRERA